MLKDTLIRTKPKYASFIVRIWQEPREKESHNSAWRGSIENIQNGQKQYFTDTRALIRFIREMSQTLGISWDERKYIA